MTKRACYAKHLGNCSSKLSDEHFYLPMAVLKEFFPKEFKTKGFKSSVASRSSLSSKILCIKHNSELAKLDKAATKLFRLLRNISRNTQPPGKEIINGNLFERWALKVILGLHNSKQLHFEINEKTHSELVEIVFGHRMLPTNSGLYLASAPIDTKQAITCSLGFNPINDSLFTLSFCNVYFAINLNKNSDGNLTLPTPLVHSAFHPYGIQFNQGEGHEVHLQFSWD